MSRPLIYRAAQIRLVEIWDYTVEKWDEEQADDYLREWVHVWSVPSLNVTFGGV